MTRLLGSFRAGAWVALEDLVRTMNRFAGGRWVRSATAVEATRRAGWVRAARAIRGRLTVTPI